MKISRIIGKLKRKLRALTVVVGVIRQESDSIDKFPAGKFLAAKFLLKPLKFTCQVLAIGLILCASAPTAFAWGEEGHRMVGDIASRYLTPLARQRITALLANDRFADGQSSDRRTLGQVAYWADEIKDYEWGRRKRRWHYDDISFCTKPEYGKYCSDNNCASAQIALQLAILGDIKKSSRQRNEALKWVVHLMGDIHQPLHAATRRDNGGNKVQASFFGERDNPPYGSINLHVIWDIHMLRRLIGERKGEAGIVSMPLADRDKLAWEQGSLADWISDSHALARDFVYPALPVAATCARAIKEVVQIGDLYYTQSVPILEMQIRKAGVRLARVLNETLER